MLRYHVNVHADVCTTFHKRLDMCTGEGRCNTGRVSKLLHVHSTCGSLNAPHRCSSIRLSQMRTKQINRGLTWIWTITRVRSVSDGLGSRVRKQAQWAGQDRTRMSTSVLISSHRHVVVCVHTPPRLRVLDTTDRIVRIPNEFMCRSILSFSSTFVPRSAMLLSDCTYCRLTCFPRTADCSHN